MPLKGNLSALQILHSRFKNRGNIVEFVVMIPDSVEYELLSNQVKAAKIDLFRFDTNKVHEKPVSLQQQRWGLEDDTGNDTWIGAPLAQIVEQKKWKNLILVPLSNLLVDPSEVFLSLELHKREDFDVCFAGERVIGAGWVIMRGELLIGLYRQHQDIMWTRGGLSWAIRKPLYPFKVGIHHCSRVRPRLAVDLRLNSERNAAVYQNIDDETFATPDFSYENWLLNSGWEEIYCDFAPLQIEVEPTNNCNGKCFACPQETMKRDRYEMPLKLFDKAVSDISTGSDIHWTFSGMGEPLLHPHIKDFVSRLKYSLLSLHTSLQLLPDESFPWSFIDHVRVSVDSLSAEKFVEIRPGCNWKNMENFMIFARAQKELYPDCFPEIGVSMVRHSMAENMLYTFIRYWRQACTPVFKENFFRWPFDLSPSPIQWFQILGESEFGKHGMRTSKVDFTPVKRRPCQRAMLTMNIQSDGNVSVCSFDIEGRQSIGNIKEQSIFEIWRSPIAKDFRSQHLQQTFFANSICKDCRDWYHPV